MYSRLLNRAALCCYSGVTLSRLSCMRSLKSCCFKVAPLRSSRLFFRLPLTTDQRASMELSSGV